MLSKKQVIGILQADATRAFAVGVRFSGELRHYERGRLSGISASLYFLTGAKDAAIALMESQLINLGDDKVDLVDIKDGPAALEEFYKTLEPYSGEPS